MRRIALALLLLAGCGEGLVDPDYRGEPLFRLEGQIRSVVELPPEVREAPIRASVFWNPEVRPGAPARLLEQASTSAEVRFPATFVMTFFRPPEPQHFAAVQPPQAVGLILVYADLDADGRYDPERDRLVGGTREIGVLYTPPATGDGAGSFVIIELEDGLCLREVEDDDHEDGREPGHESGPYCDATTPCGTGLVCDVGASICETDHPLDLEISARFRPEVLSCD